MAKYQAYTEYKDSGVEWLGKIPSHWEAKRLGSFFEERREKVSDKDYPALSVTMKGIVPQLETAAKTDAGDNRKLVLVNDFVINSRSDRKGSSGTSNLNGSVSLISIVMEPKKINPQFAHHLLRSYPFQEEFYRYGKGIVADLWSTNSSEMKNIILPAIPENEQIKIANFLDHETAKIDHLIEKQQQLIELLKEKRQAVISHAVTKGLDPNVPMKDSGVEWLGEVPEHWNVTCLARISGIKRGSGYQNIEMEVEGQDTIQMLRIADMHEIAPALIVKNTEVIRYLVEEGDILVAGTGATAGISMLVPKECNGWVHSYNSIKVKVDSKKVNSAFLQLFLISDYIKKSLDVSFVGSAQPFVDTNGLGRLRVLLPPLHEQINIYDYLNIQTRKIDLLISKAQSAIQLMQERRTALISAAVTGKIDVRNWQA